MKKFIGIDVQINRGVPVAIMEECGDVVETIWFPAENAPRQLCDLLGRQDLQGCQVGIDAPRQPLDQLRTWSYSRGRWFQGEGKRGRHCEIAVKTLGLANPQWTPLKAEAPDWMRLGFALFAAAVRAGAVTHEVFPSATYKLLDQPSVTEKVSFGFSGMLPGPKDMLDAIAGAFSVWRFARGVGSSVGGGDGLGAIILPASIDLKHAVLKWPV